MGLHRRLLLQAGGIIVLAAAMFASAVYFSFRNELREAERNLLDTDRIVAAQVESEFDTILSVQREASKRFGPQLSAAGGADAMGSVLAALKAGLPLVDSLVVADAQGVVRAGSRGLPDTPMSVLDRDYFHILRDAPAGSVEVTPLLRNKVTGQQNFLVTGRLDADSGFAGVVAAAIRPEHIGAFFAKVNTVTDAKLSVVRHDGTMLFRIPSGHLGAKVATHWTRESSTFGATRFTSVLDGIERIAAYRVLPNVPVVVVVSRDIDAVLKPWTERMLWLGAGAAALLCVVLPLWLFARHQASQRRTALSALRESEERLRTILAASPFPIQVSRRDDGTVLLQNDRAAALFGEDTAVGLLHSDGAFDAPWERMVLAERLRRDGTIQDAEVRLHTASGRIFWALVSATLIRIGAQEVILAVVNDISARKQSEEDIQAAHRAAEMALADLTRAQQRLVQSEKLASLGALVAGIAHEVNTPIGIAVTTSSYLADSLVQFGKAAADGRLRRSDLDAFLNTQKEGMSLLVSNIDRAADLIQSFKQVAADRTSDVRRSFDLAPWLNDLLFSLSPTWKRAGHQVVVECPSGIAMDSYPGVLSQVLSNFVTNSLVHGYRPGEAGTIRITATAPDADTVQLVYEDDGRGIPEASLERIFEPFFTTRRNAGNTGLGLHIVHNLVIGPLGGTISVTSRPDAGTRFVLRFPREPGRVAAGVDAPANA